MRRAIICPPEAVAEQQRLQVQRRLARLNRLRTRLSGAMQLELDWTNRVIRAVSRMAKYQKLTRRLHQQIADLEGRTT